MKESYPLRIAPFLARYSRAFVPGRRSSGPRVYENKLLPIPGILWGQRLYGYLWIHPAFPC